MTSKGVLIKYGNFSPGARESFMPSASESQYNTLSSLRKNEVIASNYSNPCEFYQTALDGKNLVIPTNPDDKDIGLWSEQISNDDGTFTTPIVLTLSSQKYFISQGLTLTFDENNNIFATKINVKWYRDEEILSQTDSDATSPIHVVYNTVELYNKIEITFYSLNMAKNRLKLTSISYGFGLDLTPEYLKNVKIIQEINPISSELSYNTADITISYDSESELVFQEKQLLQIYFNGRLLQTSFVQSSKRTQKTQWSVKAFSYIGLMDDVPFAGGVYNKKNSFDLLEEIFNAAEISFVADETLKNISVTGYIPYTSCREALMLVLFATMSTADTSNADIVKIRFLEDDIKQKVNLDRIMTGQSFEEEETITGVELFFHSYYKLQETTVVYEASQDEPNIGEEVLIKFGEPLHSLSIENGEILSSGDNYAVIKANNENCILIGGKYGHSAVSRRKNASIIVAGTSEKVVSINSATLLSQDNIDKILERCYNYFVRSRVSNVRIAERKRTISGVTSYDNPIEVGDVIEFETEYLGDVQGRVVKQTYNLNGGIIIKNCVVR